MATGTRTQSRRDRVARAYVRRELYAHTAAAREQFAAAAIPAGRVKSTAEFAAIPPVALHEAGTGARHLVQPTREGLLRTSQPVMRLRTAWASTWGNWGRFLAVIEPSYRPVHYFTAGSVAIGAAAKDLVRLANLGAAWLRSVGLDGHDAIGLLEGANGAVEPWELSGGTRRGGIGLAVVDSPADAAALKLSVVAGTPEAIVAALAGGAWPELRVALVFGRDAAPVATRLTRAGAETQVAVRRAWAVPGTRSAWFECVGGPAMGWHVNADAELIERGEDDEALWTGIGWAGTVFLRLRTDARISAVERDACPRCGHSAGRVFVLDGSPALARWLREDARVAEFRLTATGADVLPVRSGPNARLVSEAKKVFPGMAVSVKPRRGWQA